MPAVLVEVSIGLERARRRSVSMVNRAEINVASSGYARCTVLISDVRKEIYGRPVEVVPLYVGLLL